MYESVSITIQASSMEDPKFLNPWILHLQKLGLELKCPFCLKMLNRPMLLPCNHILCGLCVPRSSTQFRSECSVCKQQYADGDVRAAPYMENLVTIYRSLDATISSNLFQPVSSVAAEPGRVPQQSSPSLKTIFDNGLKESVETPQEGISSNGQSKFSLTTKKRVEAWLTPAVEDGNKLLGKSDKSTPPISSKVEGFETSHPSFNVMDEDGSSSDPISNNDTEKHSRKRLAERNPDKAGGEMNDSRDIKRQKKVNGGLLDMKAKNNGCTQPNVLHSESRATSKLETEVGEPSGAKTPITSDSCDASRHICAFCQSSGVTDGSGPMLHFDKGKVVTGDAATNSKVIHVHDQCIGWTPQVYFVGETVKNLKEEVARAAKLKCSRCGKRGAALGCFAKSCRKSYHVPCAVEILDCRWDVDDFLMLCPDHSLVKFPSERSKFKNDVSEKQHSVPTETTSKESTFWGASDNGMKQRVFCGSDLSTEEKCLLVKFASICGATVSKFWKPNVTHVIAATDAKGACIRTLKILHAILHGRWILNIDWIKACMKAMHPVDEESYEVTLDNYGCRDGPKTGRLRALDNGSKLFNGLSFYFSGDFMPAYKEELLKLVVTAGGTVIEGEEQLFARSRDPLKTPSATLVVYKDDPEVLGLLKRLKVAGNLALETGSPVISHTWLLESIAACKLQPLGC